MKTPNTPHSLDHQMHTAPRRIVRQVAQPDALHDHALPGEARVAVYLHAQDAVAEGAVGGGRFEEGVLFGARFAEGDGVYGLWGVGEQ